MSIIKSIKQVLGLSGTASENHFWDGSVANQLSLKRGTPEAPGATVMQVVDGIVKAPTSFPVFIGNNTGSGSITNNVPSKLGIIPIVDTGSYWNAANSRYIPQIAGFYRVTVKCIGVSSTSQVQLAAASVYKNGAFYSEGSFLFGAALAGVSDARSECNTIVQLNGTTDYVEAWARVVGAGSLSVNSFEMTIDLVRAN